MKIVSTTNVLMNVKVKWGIRLGQNNNGKRARAV